MGRILADVDIGNEFGQYFTSNKAPDTLGSIVSVIVQNAFVLAGIIAFVLLIFGGFGVIVGAGSGDSKKLEQGRKAITGAVIGLIVVIGSFWIVQVIQGITGVPLLPQ